MRAPVLRDRVNVIFTVVGLGLLCVFVDETTFDYDFWSELGVYLVPVAVVSIAWLLVRNNERSKVFAHGLGIFTIVVACLIPWKCNYNSDAQDFTLIFIAVVGSILGKRMQYVGMCITADIVMGLQIISILS